jgi:two-component system sensor histidine kinase DesK
VVEDVRQRPARRSRVWKVTVGTCVALMASLLVTGAEGMTAIVMPFLIAATAVGVAVWAVWRSRKDRAAYEARLTAWAASEAVLAERIAIARDLHDIVSHGLGLITVRAAAARLAGDDPAEAQDALADIETAGRSATAELRRMLTVLRTPDGSMTGRGFGDRPGNDAEDGLWRATGPRFPMDTLALLPDIVHAAPGLRVEFVLEPMDEVSPGVQVAVCKTVREALHNAARHAGPTDVHVEVRREGDAVVTSIADGGPDGAWPPAPGAGHGLLGLHERVTGLGGTLHAAPEHPGFRVTARIPDRAAE